MSSRLRRALIAGSVIACLTGPVRAQLPGDLTDDCVVNNDDVAPFVAVLTGFIEDEALEAASDVDGNGTADARDIPGFLDQLLGSAQCQTCITEASGFAGGNGTIANPYQVCNAAQLQLVGSFLTSHFVLTADIDLTGVNFTPIAFTTFGDNVIDYHGVFDGAGHVVRNLTINQPGTDVIGLFGKISPSSIIQDLGVENVNLHGKLCVGGLLAENDGLVRRCYVTGTVRGTSFVGGMVGDNRDTMDDCYANVSTTGSSSVGGFAGVSFLSPFYNRCYSVGSVTGTSTTGGFIGQVLGSHTVTNCFWDTQTSGRATSAGGTGRNTAQMMQQATFVGWNFATVWTMPPADYPRLAWE